MQNKVLIIDDDKNVIRQVSHWLKDFGYQPSFVPNPLLVIDRLKTEHFDLILLDIAMPGKMG